MRWRIPSRVLLILIGLAAVALVVIRTEGALDDWSACYASKPGASTDAPFTSRSLRGERPSGGSVISVIASILMLLVIAIAKSAITRWGAFLVVLLPLALVLGPMHRCDQNGCEICGAIWFLALYAQFPLAVLMLALSSFLALIRGIKGSWR